MFFTQLLLIVLFICVLVGISLFFLTKTQDIKQAHIKKLQIINQLISLHKTQLNFREKGLLQYNFLKYNLDESLNVQFDIKMI